MKKLTFLFIMLAFIGLQSVEAQRTITGTVTSVEDGLVLPGVSVLIKNTTTGVVTDVSGKYSISVPSGDVTLVFQFLGMMKKEVATGNSSKINVALEPDDVGLEEVVVTAIGIKRKTKALGYAVQGIDGEELTSSGEVNAIQSLAAKAAGVQVLSTSGTPGSSSKILIRGNASFTGENQPLIVIDGVPFDNRTMTTSSNDYPYNPGLQGVNDGNRAIDIDPEDIESVTILKGPAAAALYGVRAGTGAIVYTTKRGKSGGLKATYSYKLDVSNVNKLPDLQNKYAGGTGGGGWDFDAGQSTQGDATFNVADFGPDMLWGTADDVAAGTSYSWGPRMSDLGITPVNNAENFFETALSHTHNLSLSGGSESTSFRLSFGRTDQNGIVPNSNFKRTSVKLTSDHKFSERLKVGGSINYVNSGGIKAQNGSNLGGVMLPLMRTPPSFNLLHPEYGYKYPTGQQHQYFFIYDNPYFSVYESPHTDKVNRVYGNAFTEYKPLDWLNVTYRVGLDAYSDHRKQIFATGSWQATDLSGEIFEDTKTNMEVNSDLLVTASKSFMEKIQASLTVGQNFNHREYQDLFGRGRQLGVPFFYNIGNAAELYTDENSQTIRTAAAFYDLNLEYGDIFFLSATGRNEWASTFGTDKNNFFYPSVSTSFVFSELLEDDGILSMGKLRLAWAQSGINAPVYSSRTYYNAPFMTDGFTGGLAYPYMGLSGLGYSNVMGSPTLSPEKVTSREVGLDVRFFQGRLNMDFTYYNNLTTDILVQRPLPSSTGFRQVQANSGEMSNKGIELTISGDPIKTADFGWNISANFSKNTSEVLALAEGVDEVQIASAFNSIGSYAIVGEPYGAFFGTKWERDDNNNLIIDDNGLPITQLETGGIGNPFPDWLANVRNTFTYRGASLTALLDIRKGGDIWAGTVARLNRQGTGGPSVDRERTFLIPGVVVEYDASGNIVYNADGKAVSSGEVNSTEVSGIDYWQNYKGDFATAEEIVTDGSWIRLREIGINYRFNFGSKVKFAKYIAISATGRNLWYKSDYPGVDPETSLTGAGGDPEAAGGALTGFDYFNNPSTKSFIFGVRIGF